MAELTTIIRWVPSRDASEDHAIKGGKTGDQDRKQNMSMGRRPTGERRCETAGGWPSSAGHRAEHRAGTNQLVRSVRRHGHTPGGITGHGASRIRGHYPWPPEFPYETVALEVGDGGHKVPWSSPEQWILNDCAGYLNTLRSEKGDVFQVELFGTPNYFIGDPDLARTLFKHPDLSALEANLSIGRRLFGSPLLYADRPQQQTTRSALMPLFAASRIERQRETIESCITSALQACGGPTPVHVVGELIGLDVTAKLLLNTTFSHAALHELRHWLTQMGVALYADDTWTNEERLTEAGMRARRNARRLLSQYLDLSPESPSPLISFLHARAGRGTTEEVLDEVVGMLFAGLVTTASAFTSSAYLTMTRPGRQPLPMQALHHFPPAHLVPRMATAEVETGGITIRPGTLVNLDMIRLCAPEPAGHGLPWYFGIGAKRCIGASLAATELEIWGEHLVSNNYILTGHPIRLAYLPVLYPRSPLWIHKAA